MSVSGPQGPSGPSALSDIDEPDPAPAPAPAPPPAGTTTGGATASWDAHRADSAVGARFDAAACEPASSTHTVRYDEVKTVEFRPGYMTMHPSWNAPPLDAAFRTFLGAPLLDLNRVTPEMLKDLSPTDLKQFMEIVGSHEFSVYAADARGNDQTGLWNPFTEESDINGATALAAKIWGTGDSEAFARVFAAAPDRIMEYLTGNGARVLTAENMALIMRDMKSSDGRYTSEEMAALGSVVHRYLERTAGEDPQRARAAVEQLLTQIQCSGLEMTPENLGVVVGALTAGMMKHFDEIEADAETRNAIINGVLDLVGGAANALDGATAGLVGFALAALKTAYNAVDDPENHAAVARQFKGAIKLELLQNPPAGWDPTMVGTCIDWLETTLDNNGVS